MHPPSIEHLQQTPLFGGVGAEALALLLDGASVLERPAGGFFLREGDVNGGLYLLLDGAVAVRRHWDGRDILLRRLEAGDCFGEMMPLDLSPRSASVQALAPSRALEVGAAQMLRLFEQDGRQFAIIQMNIARELSRRLRHVYAQLFGARSEADRTLVARLLQPRTD